MTRMGRSTAQVALAYQHMTDDRDRAIADRLGLGAMIRGAHGPKGDVDSTWTPGPWWHVRDTDANTWKGRLQRITPLNRPFIVCPRQDSNLRHPL